ncbi:MAG TPA: alpha-amylase family protein, partial [Planctomycetota bacterium]|nr:alpha-amylase family protein [Planctomycetota bacterium]
FPTKGYATLTLQRKSGIDCPDGRLTLTFRANTGYKHPYPWNQCTWWMVNFLLIAPADEEEKIDEALAGLETNRFDALVKQYIPPFDAAQGREPAERPGGSQKFEIRDGHVVKDGKPFLRLLYHGWGWSDVLKYYRFYAWTNTINLGKSTKFFYYDDLYRDGWRKRMATDAFPTDWFTDARSAWENGYLVNYYSSREMLWYLPSGYRRDHPDSTGIDASGKRHSYDRRFGEPGGDTYTRRSATVIADLAKLHPASGTIEIFEEYWLPDSGFHPEAMKLYREWLKTKYGTVAKLNAEWGTDYATFDDITPPKVSERSGNHVNHTLWKGEMNVRSARIAYDAIKEADPNRIVAGAKGQFGIASWSYAPATDIFGWYGHANMDVARAASEHFGKILCPVHVNICQHQTMRGGTPVGTDPFMNYRRAAYSLMLTRVIDGAKSIFNEDYGLGHDFHYFHRTRAMRGQKLEGTLGGEVRLDRDDYPDVYLESKSLQLARVNQLLVRLAPVFLPTKVPKSRVAMLATTESSFIDGPNAFYSNQTRLGDELFKRLQMPYDVLRRPIFDRMSDYDVVVLGPLAQALTPEDAEKVKTFVGRGGKLLVLPPTAHTDARTLKGRDFGLAGLMGCALTGGVDSGGEMKITVTRNDLIRSLKPGDVLPGFTNLMKGRLPGLEVTDGTTLAEVDGKPVAVASKDGRVVTVSLPHAVASWSALPCERFDPNSVRFFHDVFDHWKVDRPVVLTGAGETHLIDAGVLEGRGTGGNRYHLVLLASYSEKPQRVNAKLTFLADGSYDVVDVTGERPLIAKDAGGQNVFQPDPVYRRSFYAAKGVSAEVLKKAGVELDVGALMGRVLLVRRVIPEGSPVWVNCPGYELRALIEKPVVIVPGTSEVDRKAAERVAGWFPRMGVKATIVPADEIKTRSVKNEIVIDDFKVADFTSRPLDVDTTLILIGNEATNPILRHLGAAGTFCFDKVLMKVDAAFPGQGRGVIQVVESVNNEAWDWTARSRDAIVLSGSDADGLNAALNAFYDIGWPRR